MKKRKAMSGVVVAMTIAGFMSTGLSLSVIVDTVQNTFAGGGGFTAASSHLDTFESNFEKVCTTDTESENFRMDSGTSDYDSFQIRILNEEEYNSTSSDNIKEFNDIGEVDDCSVRADDSQEYLNMDVLYTIEEDGEGWVKIR